MAAGRKSSGKRKYGKAASETVESAMRRMKRGTLKSGPGGKGGKVKSRKQAIAIGLSEARKKGAKVPRKSSSRKSSGRKS
jgi:ribosomal protein S21